MRDKQAEGDDRSLPNAILCEWVCGMCVCVCVAILISLIWHQSVCLSLSESRVKSFNVCVSRLCVWINGQKKRMSDWLTSVFSAIEATLFVCESYTVWVVNMHLCSLIMFFLVIINICVCVSIPYRDRHTWSTHSGCSEWWRVKVEGERGIRIITMGRGMDIPDC